MALMDKPGSNALSEGKRLADMGEYAAAFQHYQIAEKHAVDDTVLAQSWVAQARAYQRGHGVSEDDDIAFGLYEAASKLGSKTADLARADMLRTGEGTEIDFTQAQRLYQRYPETPRALLALAELESDAVAQTTLRQRAKQLLTDQAEAGKPNAMVKLARFYRDHGSEGHLLRQADYWYARAIEAGQFSAITELARFRATHMNPLDLQQWVLLWPAIQRNDPRSFTYLARAYETGDVFASDIQRAKDFYQHAANAGDERATLRLAQLERKVAREETRRRQQLVKAHQPHKAASTPKASQTPKTIPGAPQLAKAQAHLAGLHGTPDIEKAYSLFLDAAEQGHPEAQYHVGLGYARGFGLEKNVDQARYWLGKAKANGYVFADEILDAVGGP